MNRDPSKSSELDVARWLQVDEVCMHFEQQLRAGLSPRIETFLTDDPEPFRSHLLTGLLQLEFEFRSGTEGSLEIQEYLERFPQDHSLIQAVHEEQEFQSLARRFKQKFKAGQTPGHELPATSEYARYQLQGEVARGGMGVVYKVRDTELNRTLAMKVVALAPSESIESSHLLSRFLAEAQVTAQLDHPGIVSVHELGVDTAGRPFFTMKLVKGQEFSKIVELVAEEREGWNLSRAVGGIIKVCQTIAYAHSRKVLHRDLKPANIMVGRFGEVYLMDWGLAKVIGRDDIHDIRLTSETQLAVTEIHTPRSVGESSTADSPLITMDGAVVGTPAFMSPEQARGDVAAVDHQSDIYSLGAVLYHLLAGHPPYVERGTTISPRTVLARVLDGPPKAISKINRKAPPELVAICDKAMVRDKSLRYESSDELAEDLQAYLDNRVVRAYQTGAAAELKAWVIRNRLAATLAASLLMVISLFLGWKIHQDQLHATKLSKQLAHQNLQAGQALCEQGRIDHGLHLFVRGLRNLEECPESSVQQLKSDIEANLNGWIPRCNHLLQSMETESVEQYTGITEQSVLAFSTDGKRVVTGSQREHTVKVWSVESGDQIGETVQHDGPVKAVYFHQGGREVVSIGQDQTIRRWSEQGRVSDKPIITGTDPKAMAFDPDRAHVYIGADDGSVTVWSVESGKPTGQAMRHSSPVTALDLSTDGKLLVVGYQDNTAQLWSVESRRNTIEPFVHPGPLKSVAFSPDGLKVATDSADGTGSNDSTARLWSVETGQTVGSPMKHGNGINCMAFSPDSKHIATGSGEVTAALWSAKDGSRIATLRHPSRVLTLAFSTNSELLTLTGSYGYAVRLWSVRTGLEVGNEIYRRGRINAIAFSPTSKKVRPKLAVASAGLLEVWSADVVPRPQGIGTEDTVWALDFRPDGDAVAIGGFKSTTRILSKNGEETEETELSGPGLWDACFNSDGSKLLLSYRWEEFAALWTSEGGKFEGGKFEEFKHGGEVRSAVFSPDETLVATGSFDGTAKIWDLSGNEWHSFDHNKAGDSDDNTAVVEDLAFSRDGSMLFTACSDHKVRFWSIKTGQPTLELTGHSDSVLALELSPDGKLIATGGRDHTVRFWDADTGRPTGPILEHAHWVEDLAFSPDGLKVVTACNDGNAQLWSVVSGEKLGPPFTHEFHLRAVAFDPNGEYVIVGGRNPEAKIWRIPRAETNQPADFDLLVRILTGKTMDENGVLRRLTHQEWKKLIDMSPLDQTDLNHSLLLFPNLPNQLQPPPHSP